MQTPPRKALQDSLLVALLAVLLYAPGIGKRDLWEADEARYPEVAREMIDEGRWLVPVLNGNVYMEKPPVYMWAMRIPHAIQGDLTEAGARSVVVGFAALTLAATYGLGAILVGRLAGWVAALALATNLEFSEFAQTAVMDVPITMFTTLALLCYAVWSRLGWRPRTMQAAAYAAMGLGVLTKGPLAILLPPLVMAADGLRRHGKAAFRAKHLRWGPLVTLGTLMLWLGPATAIEGKQFFAFMIERHVVERAASETAPHARPFYSYFAKFPFTFLPWSLLLPAALAAAWRERGRPLEPEPAVEGMKLGALWLGVMIVALSFISGKRSQYLIPAYPGAALLVASWFEYARGRLGERERPEFRRLALGAAGALALGAALLALGTFLVPPVGMALGERGAHFRSLLAIGGFAPLGWMFLAALALGLAAVLMKTETHGGAVAALGVLGAAAVLLLQLVFRPGANPEVSARPIGERMGAVARAGGEVGQYLMYNRGVYNYYGRVRPIADLLDPESTRAFLASGRPRFVAIDKKDYRGVPPLDGAAEVVFECLSGKRGRYLVANAPGRALYERVVGPVTVKPPKDKKK